MRLSLNLLAVSEVVTGFVFPLVLLLVGGALTGYVYPRITALRQSDEKGREIRIELVSDISEEVTTMLMTVQFVQLGTASLTQSDLDDAYKRWEIVSAVIGTKIQAYFPKEGLGGRWSAFAERITRFYALLGIGDDDQRAQGRRALLGRAGGEGDEAAEWLALRNQLLQEKNALIAEVMAGKGIKV
jgi:hypothetical protein